MMKHFSRQDNQRIAEERIRTLFREAQQAADPTYAKRYVKLANELHTKFKVPIPREFKRRFCKNCFAYFLPGKNLRVRLKHDHIVFYCLECKHLMRYVHKGRKGKDK